MTVDAILGKALYIGVTLILLVCGIGVPLPEEGVFLAAGYLGRKQDSNIWLLCLCGIMGVLLGDSIPYWAGRTFGLKILKRKPFSWVIKPRGIDKTRGFFSKYGSMTIFVGRFVAGLRMPTFFMAGSMGTSYARFLFFDLMGALISCPTSIWLAYLYGHHAEKLLRESEVYLFIGLGLIVAYIVYHILSHRPKPGEENSPQTDVSVSAEKISGE